MSAYHVDEFGGIHKNNDRSECNPVNDWHPMTQVIVDDIKKGGPISRELQKTFDLKRRGV